MLSTTSATTPKGVQVKHNDSADYSSHSASSSIWTAPSPSQIRRVRSPTLPPLAKLQRRDLTPQTIQSTPQHQRSNSSTYYTAAWGSPYELPSSSRPRFGIDKHHRRSSTITIDGSPLNTIKGKPIQRRLTSSVATHSFVEKGHKSNRQLSRRLAEALDKGTPGSGSGKPRYGFTQDWLRTHRTQGNNSEKGNWWSSDSGNSDTETAALEAHNVDINLKEDWLGISPKSSLDTVLDTLSSTTGYPSTKAINFVQDLSSGVPKLDVRHKALPSDVTLKQQDFDDIFSLDHEHTSSIPNTSAPRFAKTLPALLPMSGSATASMEEKLLPQPPLNRTTSEAPTVSTVGNVSESISGNQRPSISSAVSFQRPRKRVQYRGKTCVIALPLEIYSSLRSDSRTFLKPDESDSRLLQWTSKGFDVSGFDLSESLSGGRPLPYGQSREIYPDPLVMEEERDQKTYRVSIPDKRAWDDYVNELKEERLKALGVSFGGEDCSPTVLQVPLQGSQQSLHQKTKLRQPLAESAISSINARPDHNHSVNSSLSSGPVSIGPKASMTNMAQHEQAVRPGHYHFPRPSISFYSEQPYRINQQRNKGYTQGSRSVSPGPHVSHSAASPLLGPHTQGDAIGKQGRPLVQLQPEHDPVVPHSFLRADQSEHPQSNDSRQLLNEPGRSTNTDFFTNHYISQPEIASPVPQGHRHSLSETLQREIEEADYHLEESFRRQLEEEDDLPYESTKGDEVSIGICGRNGGHSINASHNLGNRSEGSVSDPETNPSVTNSPAPVQLPQLDCDRIIAGQPYKPSGSKLNVNAQEFVFEPKRASKPSVFAFLGNQTSTEAINHLLPNELPVDENNGTSLYSKLNVAAPAFTPGNPSTYAQPLREFSFSSVGPASKPDAESFNSNSYSRTSSIGQHSSNVETTAPSIFENSNFSSVRKSARRSKAIPIVKPREAQTRVDRDDEGQEDESGRITQADGRQKRTKRHTDSGDQVPLFAESSYNSHVTAWLVDEGELSNSPNRDKDVSPMEKATDELKELVDDLTASEVSSLTAGLNLADADEKLLEPFEFKDLAEAAVFNAARPRSLSASTSGRSGRKCRNIASLENELVLDGHGHRASLSHSQMSSLSASVVPFALGSDGERHIVDQLQPDRGSFQNDRRSRSSVSFNDADFDEGRRYDEPSYQEIDAVMKHLNGEDSDLGVERTNVSDRPRRSDQSLSHAETNTSDEGRHLRSARQTHSVPSPSPNRLQQPFQYLPERSYESVDSADAELVARNARFSPSFRPPRHCATDFKSPLYHLNTIDDAPVSDWDEVLDSADEGRLQSRSGFFDKRVNDLVDSVVRQRLAPLEENLAAMNNSLALLSKRSSNGSLRRSVSAKVEHSDADDEDEDGLRAISPMKDRKLDKLKASVLETISSQQQFASTKDLAEIMQTLAEVKESLHQQRPSSTGDIKAAVEEAIARQMRGKSGPVTSSHQSATAERYQLQIAGLESMLKVAEARAEDESKSRRTVEDSIAEHQRLLRMAQSDAAEQRESAEETERSLREFHDERQQAMRRTAVLEAAQENLQSTVSELSEKNAALEETLEEYRLSSTQWREEIDEAKIENKNLDRTIHALKSELEDSIRARHSLHTKFDRLQEDMTLAARDIARDQSAWRNREEDHQAKLDMQSARLEAETRTRERLESEVEKLVAQEKEAAKASFLVEHVQGENVRLLALVDELKSDNHKYQTENARLEREVHDAKEIGKLEIERVRLATEVEVEKANRQVELVRADLESMVDRLQSQVENANGDIAKLTARYELMLEEASESRSEALREAADSRDAALQEHYRFHERTLTEMKSQHERALNSLSEEKQRDLDRAAKGQQLAETYLNARLGLADEKIQHYQERISHLEEKLEITKTAAQAAAQAAQSAKGSSSPSRNRASLSFSPGSGIPEKISPQALRESIMVLQEQLQEREGCIEKLGQELATVDKDAPNKIKDRDMEITWLRELLGVRIDDLQDIIATISQPSFDREAIKDAAIRLQANLQMEQQEKERAIAGGQTFPALSSISSLAASPRALPLAAAAAWGNWRRGQTSIGGLSELVNGSTSQTPSRSSLSTPGFLSGLLTPPSTTVRQTPQPPNTSTVSRPVSSGHRPLRGYTTPRQSSSRQDENKPPSPQFPPKTPPLMRKASYDPDAESPQYSLARYIKDDDSTGDGSAVLLKTENGDEPFGPNPRS